ncbi:ParA family protein [Bacillaceae bacterium C204]|uniref:ParA family protein n=1 Tax=Neobacillus sp. 204 TaxID=3383351 RepID=UPI00397E03EF
MSAKVITISLQKGGVGKSTTTGILAYLMAQEGFKVLVVDMDSQGNVSDLLLQFDDIEDINGSTIIQAFEVGNIKPFIHKTDHPNIDVVPADDFLATLARLLYTDSLYRNENANIALHNLLEPIKDGYDYILIDTPPSLGEATANSLVASDYVIVLAEGSKWAFTAIKRFLGTVDHAKVVRGHEIDVMGILRTMTDSRRSDMKAYVEVIGEQYSELIFDTIIKRKAATGRISIEGLFNNPEIKDALDQYYKFYAEVKQRLGVTVNG